MPDTLRTPSPRACAAWIALLLAASLASAAPAPPRHIRPGSAPVAFEFSGKDEHLDLAFKARAGDFIRVIIDAEHLVYAPGVRRQVAVQLADARHVMRDQRQLDLDERRAITFPTALDTDGTYVLGIMPLQATGTARVRVVRSIGAHLVVNAPAPTELVVRQGEPLAFAFEGRATGAGLILFGTDTTEPPQGTLLLLEPDRQALTPRRTRLEIGGEVSPGTHAFYLPVQVRAPGGIHALFEPAPSGSGKFALRVASTEGGTALLPGQPLDISLSAARPVHLSFETSAADATPAFEISGTFPGDADLLVVMIEQSASVTRRFGGCERLDGNAGIRRCATRPGDLPRPGRHALLLATRSVAPVAAHVVIRPQG